MQVVKPRELGSRELWAGRAGRPEVEKVELGWEGSRQPSAAPSNPSHWVVQGPRSKPDASPWVSLLFSLEKASLVPSSA